jgi:hypothetical protein
VTRHLMVVLTDPLPGQEDEYNKWYTETHLPEILRTPGFLAAQRFHLDAGASDVSAYSYLAIYEVDGDLDEARRALAADRANRTPAPAAMSSERVVWWFSAVTERITG